MLKRKDAQWSLKLSGSFGGHAGRRIDALWNEPPKRKSRFTTNVGGAVDMLSQGKKMGGGPSVLRTQDIKAPPDSLNFA